ncbi:MAG: hypothetical protein ABIQ60_02150 [Burkholderiaceae bacterium]
MRKTWVGWFAVALGVGCSPTLDWREVAPEGGTLRVLFPCRPDHHARPMAIAGSKVQLDMFVCAAEGATFALSLVDEVDPTRIRATLIELREAAVRNVQGAAVRQEPLQIPGMTSNPEAWRLRLSGRLPDGVAIEEHAAFFTHGRRVYQATVIGSRPVPQAVETFFGSLKFAG